MKRLIFILLFLNLLPLLIHGVLALYYPHSALDPFLIKKYLDLKKPFPFELIQGVLLWIGLVVGILYLLTYRPKQNVGFSRFGTRKDRKKAGLNAKDGFMLGEYVNISIPQGQKTINPEDIKVKKSLTSFLFNKHAFNLVNKPLAICLLAPPGTGKTSGIAIPSLLKDPNSYVVHDPKGEIFEITAPTRKMKFNNTILRFDPMGTGAERATFNPLDQNVMDKDRNKRRSQVEMVAKKLIRDDKNGDDYFISNARAVFIFVASWLIEVNGGTSMPEVADKILQSAAPEQDFQNMIEYLKENYEFSQDDLGTVKFKDPLIGAIFRDGNAALSSASAEEAWGSIKSTLIPKISMFSNDMLIREATIGTNSIIPMDFKDSAVTLYIIVRDEDSEVLSPIVNLLCEFLATKFISMQPKEWKELKKKELKTKEALLKSITEDSFEKDELIEEIKTLKTLIKRGNPTLIRFLIDEFPRLGRMNAIFNLPAISRGARVSTVFIAQSIGQMENIYGKENIQVLVDNTEYWYVFRQNSQSSSETMSKLIGYQSTKNVNKSTGRSGGSTSVSEEKWDLITDQFVRAIPSEISEVKFLGIPLSKILQKINKKWAIKYSHTDTYGLCLKGGMFHKPFFCRNTSWFRYPEFRESVEKYEHLLPLIRGD